MTISLSKREREKEELLLTPLPFHYPHSPTPRPDQWLLLPIARGVNQIELRPRGRFFPFFPPSFFAGQ